MDGKEPMNDRKRALMMARQYRICPPDEVRDDPSAAAMVRRHVAGCPLCAMQTREADAPWRALTRTIEKAFREGQKASEPPGPKPGQLRCLNPLSRPWRMDRFYNPPMVLILECLSSHGAIHRVRAALVFPDIRLAAPGDLIVSIERSGGGDIFVESWNILTLRRDYLGPLVDTLGSEIITAVEALSGDPEGYPAWAMMPRPFFQRGSESPDPRREFRKLERNVGEVFAGLRPVYGSARETEKSVETAAPGVYWKKRPQGVDEALALARFPDYQLPLAAAEGHEAAMAANLAVLRDGEVQRFVPVPLTIFGKTGNLMIAGRITGLPAGITPSRLICLLEMPGGTVLSPVHCRWDPEDGNFAVSFDGVEAIEGTLRIAVLVNGLE